MKLTRQEQRQRSRILTHCMNNNRTAMEEFKLILDKKSELSGTDRRYLEREVLIAKTNENIERAKAAHLI